MTKMPCFRVFVDFLLSFPNCGKSEFEYQFGFMLCFSHAFPENMKQT